LRIERIDMMECIRKGLATGCGKARNFFLGAILAMPVATMAAVQASYYVSPVGSDANAGSEAAPFRTLAHARDVVRTVNTSMSGDIVVTLRGGTYPLTSPLVLGNKDGGTNGHDVKYVNYPGEAPLLTGGQPIRRWQIHDQAKGIWKATGVSLRFRQLYVAGSKAVRARSPNLGASGEANFYRLTKVDTTGRALNVSNSNVSAWGNPTKVEMHLMIAWADATLRLASTTSMGSYTKVDIQDPERTMLFNRPYPMLGATFGDKNKQQCFYFENAYEFLDTPGEWYLDESTSTLYYMPRKGEDMATVTVVAPVLENLVTIAGNSTSDMVGHIAFEGIAFAHSSFMRPSKSGFLDLQAGQFNVAAPGGNNYMLWRPASGVTVTNAHHIRFEKNIFAQMAASGLDFVSGTHDDRIQGNLFTDLGGTAVTLGKFAQDTLTEIHLAYNPTDKNEISTDDTVQNNFVTKTTTEIQGALGIGAGYPRRVVIQHNEVSYTNYSGISVGFGWNKSANAMTGNKINRNHIHHVAQILADAGPIYTLSNQGTGSEIQYNYIHDISQSPWADYWVCPIYLDEGSSGFDVSHNVFQNAPGGVACNSCGAYTQSDNDGASATTIASAGIEAAYAGVKNAALPAVRFPDDTTRGATLFQNANYGGLNAWLATGSYTLAQLNAAGIPDNAVGSIRLDSGVTVQLFDADGFQTPMGTFSSSLPDLSTLTGKLSSVRISQMTPTTAVSHRAEPRGTLRCVRGTLLATGDMATQVKILDAKGTVREMDLHSGQGDAGALPAGMYRAQDRCDGRDLGGFAVLPGI
jgi:hypothetical protein